jgi:hypothetical protein
LFALLSLGTFLTTVTAPFFNFIICFRGLDKVTQVWGGRQETSVASIARVFRLFRPLLLSFTVFYYIKRCLDL